MSEKKIFCDLILGTPLVHRAICAYAAAWAQKSANDLFSLNFRDFSDLETAQTAWKDAPPDLLVIDSRTDGTKLGAALGKAKPLLFLWAPPATSFSDSPFSGLEIRDVFEKPVRLDALLARLKSGAYALWNQDSAEAPLGPWLFSPKHRTLKDPRAENAQKLTEKEAALLEALGTAPTPLSREQLLATIWGYEDNLDTHTLETHIYNLRQKLTLLPFSPQDPFQTIEGGYLLDPAWRNPTWRTP